MLGKLNPEQMDHVLRSQVVGRIGCYADGSVYLVPITYLYDGEHIYGHTKEGLKVRMMRQNPRVCFEVDVIENMANWQSVVLQGIYEELTGEESQDVRRMLFNRMTPLLVSETSMPADSPGIHQPITASPLTLVTFRIRITEKTGRYEKR
jgi:nitroimidazol reductase NimA-like FMN-containing flavoprotein (pyridoxamine 5'-phosphate oxidase superfamily)